MSLFEMLHIVSLVLVAKVTLAKIVNLEWSLDWVQNGNPDSLFPRPVIGVNGEWPIPPIYANEGDILQLKVVNLLNESSGIHFHGIFQRGTNYYDGALGVTDCGIAPNGGEMTYNVRLDQRGSYWVHSHHGGQYPDGLRTALIINGESPYHYEEEFSLAISDWYHDTHAVNFAIFNSPNNPDGIEPIPNSVIINDKPENKLELVAGKTYRLRLISMATYAMIDVWVEGLDFQIIEADGVDCEAYTSSILQIAPAQRYSVLITIPENTSVNYRVHFELVSNMFKSDLPDVYQPEAITQLEINSNFSYFNISDSEKPDSNTFDEMQVHPLRKEASLGPTISTRLDVIFNMFSDGLNHGTFNNSVYEFPNVPPLFTALSMGENASNVNAYGPWTHSMVLEPDSVVEIILVTHDREGAHPFHLHGHTFQVVAKSFKADFSYSKLRELASSNVNPLVRDTVNLPKFGWVALRFKADNPGIWYFHCHIHWHAEVGLAGQFIESPLLLQKQKASLPNDVLENCKKQNIKTEGNAAGFPDLVTFDGLKESPKHRISKSLTGSRPANRRKFRH